MPSPAYRLRPPTAHFGHFRDSLRHRQTRRQRMLFDIGELEERRDCDTLSRSRRL